jgi:protein involved in polysaccharide export with SLBB domain
MKVFNRVWIACAIMISTVFAQSTIPPKLWLHIDAKGVEAGVADQVTGLYQVSETGELTIPLLKTPIRASGLSPQSLASQIQSSCRKIVGYKQVEVVICVSIVCGPSSAMYTVGGQVESPGMREWREGLTLHQAIEAAHGVARFGSLKRVSLIREGKELVYDLTLEKNWWVLVQIRDTIIVSAKPIGDW